MMGYIPYDFKNKTRNINDLNRYALAKTLGMFEYKGLPETIPSDRLEMLLQTNGYVFITKVNDKLYALVGSLGGELDEYFEPTKIVINNVYLKFNKELDVRKDGVLIKSDDLKMGLLPMMVKYNTLIAENDINLILNGYNSRMQKIISAPDDKTKASAEEYVNQTINGEVAVIGDNALFEGVKVHGTNSSATNSVTSLIEYNTYLQGTLETELGISSNTNMKRERLVTGEIEQSEDGLLPLVYDMMRCRIRGLKAINEKYSLDVKIDFGSVWAVKHKEFVNDVISDPVEDAQDVYSESEQDSESIEPVITGEESIPEIDGEREQARTPDPEPEPESDPEPEPEPEPEAEQEPESSEEVDPTIIININNEV